MKSCRPRFITVFFIILVILSGCENNQGKKPASRTEEEKASLIPAENR